MAAFANGSVPYDYVTLPPVTFTAANGTLAKILIDKLVAGGGAQGQSSSANILGGGRLLDATVNSTDSVARNITVWRGIETTLYANMGTATTTATTNATVTRTAGSFVTDGYLVGDLVFLMGSVGASNNGNLATVTTVAAGTLTFNGVPSGFTANTEGANLRIFRVSPHAPVPVPANSGVGSNVTTVSLVGSSYDASYDRSGIWMGPNEVLFVSMQAAVSALPAYVSINNPRVARY